MQPTELAAIDAALLRMAPADRALLESRVLPRWMRRRRRLAARNAAIVAARAIFNDPRSTYAAK
jgi:hypothetical protein